MSWLSPQNDDITGDFMVGGNTLMMQQALLNQSQFFNFEAFFLPKTVKELMRFSAYAIITNSSINPAVEKLAEYPITKFTFTPRISKNENDKDYREHLDAKKELVTTWEDIFDHIKAREFAMKCGMNYQAYGNVMVSVYQPFDRHLVCKHCKAEERAKTAKWDWDRPNLQFILYCPKCGKKGAARIKDVLVSDWRRVTLITYYPGNFDIDYDPYSGQVEYYYSVPDEEIQKIKDGNRLRLINTPIDVITAARLTKGRNAKPRIKFRKSNLYHLARMSMDLPGTETAWGMPNTIAALRDIFYLNMMKRAQLSLLLEHIMPLRIVFPGTDTGANTAIPIDLLDWRKRFSTELKKWKKDPLYIMVSPIPIAHDQMGGQGKALMLQAEMQQTEDNIINALNAPVEFVRGGLQYTGTSVSLRMLENSLLNQVNGIINLFQWVAKRISEITSLEEVDVDMLPFKMADDVQQKSLIFQMWSAGAISGNYLGQVNDFDYDDEQRKRLAENLDKALSDAKATAEAATRAQSIQSMLQNAMPPESGMAGPTVPHEQVEQLYGVLGKMKPKDAEGAIQRLSSQNPALARQLQTRMQTDPAVIQGQAQQLAGMDPAARDQAMQEMEQTNPLAAAIMNQVLAQFNVQPVFGQAGQAQQQGGPNAKPGQGGVNGQTPGKGGNEKPLPQGGPPKRANPPI